MTTLSPLQQYELDLKNNQITHDDGQYKVLTELDSLHNKLIQRQKIRNSPVGKLRRKISPRQPVKGIYLWGKVGIGKTYMMDLFYHCLPIKKQRLHFHQFMHNLHQQLNERQHQKEPLKAIAKEIADKYIVMCFDEFFVTNITDAMLLRKLFEYLFEYGLCLVTTSNTEPDQLYMDGLQREQFIPTITLLKKHTQTLHLTSEKDYRLKHVQDHGVYYTPNDSAADHDLSICFRHFNDTEIISESSIKILDRNIRIISRSETIIWFDFMDICQPPRSKDDYLELCDKYHTFIVSNVPKIKKEDNMSSTLFISFVDVLYDTRRRLILSAETPIHEIYTEGRKAFDFNRTRSRLIEMNSEGYFSNPTN